MSIADQEDEDLKMALRLSMQQNESPEPKRSKSKEDSGVEESSEAKSRLTQRELMAAAAEKRRATVGSVEIVKDVSIAGVDDEGEGKGMDLDENEAKSGNLGMELPVVEANQLFLMIFGEGVSKDVLAQWCNQGIR